MNAAARVERVPDARHEPAPLTCTVFHDFAGLDVLRTQWDEAVLRAGSTIYMTFDWLRTWWAFYGSSAELRLFVFRANERIVTVFPMYIDTLGWGPMRFRIARVVGANIPPKVFNPPLPSASAAAVLKTVFTQLLGTDRCDALSLGPVSELEGWQPAVAKVCAESPGLVSHCSIASGVHSVFHLPSDMEQYYAGLSKNERKNRRKYELRLLKKEYDTQVEVVSQPAKVVDEFEQFADQHRRQWFAEGKTGHFGAWPRALSFNRALVEAQGRLGRLRFIRIVANGRVIANQYAFAFGDRYFWELPSREVSSEWDRFSLGPTAIVTMLAQGVAEGMSRVEGGLAHYDYKVRLGAKEYATQTFRVVRVTPASRARFALYSSARAGLSGVYHKVWYRRVMPHLPPRLWHSQSSLWLRFDL
jgi:CelD/BcsL family acetyltransferase involved in cellulose biosynthesis